MYQNNHKKITVVLNGKIEVAKLFNAMAHTISGLASTVGKEELNILDYKFKDNLNSSDISEYPIIILKAKNGNQLKTLRQNATGNGIKNNSFTGEMIGGSSNEQMEQNFEADEPEFWVTAIYGEADKLNTLTKKFSLYK